MSAELVGSYIYSSFNKAFQFLDYKFIKISYIIGINVINKQESKQFSSKYCNSSEILGWNLSKFFYSIINISS